MILHYTDRAKDDIELAFKWYEKQRRGLGFEFLDCVEASIDNVRNFPEMYRILYGCFRRCVVRRFPFSIFYTVEGGKIIIHSVFDNKQDPDKRP